MNHTKRLLRIAEKILADVNFSTQQEFEEYLKNHPNYRENTRFFVNGLQVKAPPKKNNDNDNEKIFGDDRINWDSYSGMGNMPINRDIDYMGFQIELSADDFRSIVPSGRSSSDLTYLKNEIKNGRGVANPSIFADWDEENKRWIVTGHEGRSRTDAISELFGKNTKMPVHVFPYKKRARDITVEMMNAPFVPQDVAEFRDEKMMKLFERDFSKRNKKLKKHND